MLSLVQLPAEGVCINGCEFVSCTGGAEMKQRPSGCTSLFVKNLPYDTSEEAVSAAFRYCIHTHCIVWVQPSRRTFPPPLHPSEFGPVTSVRLARWHHTQKLKGVGYVQFKSGSSAAKAMHQASSDGVKVSSKQTLHAFGMDS